MHLVAGENADVVHPHLSGDVRKNLVSVLQLNSKHRVGQWLDYVPLNENRVIFGFTQNKTYFRRAELTNRNMAKTGKATLSGLTGPMRPFPGLCPGLCAWLCAWPRGPFSALMAT